MVYFSRSSLKITETLENSLCLFSTVSEEKTQEDKRFTLGSSVPSKENPDVETGENVR